MSLNQQNIESPSGRRIPAVNPPTSDSSQVACTSDLEVQNPCLETNIPTIETSTNHRNSTRHLYPDTFSMKSKTHIGAWNVRSLTDPGKLKEAIKEMERLNLQLIGLSECRWNGVGDVTVENGHRFLFSGRNINEHHRDGVGFLLSRRAAQSLLDWKPINERFIWCRLKSRVRNITIIQTYAPTEQADEETKIAYYDQLMSITNSIQKGDILIVMGDLNAKIGSENHSLEHVMGKHGLGAINSNGRLLTSFCNEANLVIGGSLFPHKPCHKATWISPDGITENQIDHFCISRLWKKCLLDVRVKRSADIGSDHHLLVASLRLKIASIQRPNQQGSRRKYNVKKLSSPQTKQSFISELHPAVQDPQQAGLQDVESLWSNVKSAFINASEKALGPQPKQMRVWMTNGTWDIIEQRRKAKNIRDSTKERIRKKQASKDYDELVKKVKTLCRRDKSNWLDKLAERAEAAAEKRDMKLLYDITREICGKKSLQSRPIRDKDGILLTSIEDQVQRFKEHFSKILNNSTLPTPTSNGTQGDTRTTRNMSLLSQPPQHSEIIKAVESMKNNKSPGVDNISAEMIKACPITTARLLHPLFIKIWETEKLPEEWLEGILVTIPKKGDLSQCRNYRGIMLLPIPSKVLTKILLNRINEKLDSTIRKQQAGFRPNRSCVDHINTLRIIIEQSVEFRTALQLVFVDYSTAFDSINRDCIWNALIQRGISPKLIRLIRAQYDGFKCRVLYNGRLSAEFNTISGVRQGCLMSPILFLIVLDDVLAQAIDGKNRGITWNLQSQLEDLAYADDICLISSRHVDMQDKIDDLITESSSVGLKINSAKTKALKINATNSHANFKAGEDTIDNVNSFTYLGSVISSDGGAANDISSRISKAQGAFSQLWKIWRSSSIYTRTKVRIFNSNVKSVLLYGCETWLMTKALEKKLQIFVNKCLRKILKIWWPNTISNKLLLEKCNQIPIQSEIKKRRWNWIGHTLRKPPTEICGQAMEWNPQGSRKRGKPKQTWRRTIEDDMKKVGYSFNRAKTTARNRGEWRRYVEALCSTGS